MIELDDPLPLTPADSIPRSWIVKTSGADCCPTYRFTRDTLPEGHTGQCRCYWNATIRSRIESELGGRHDLRDVTAIGWQHDLFVVYASGAAAKLIAGDPCVMAMTPFPIAIR